MGDWFTWMLGGDDAADSATGAPPPVAERAPSGVKKIPQMPTPPFSYTFSPPPPKPAPKRPSPPSQLIDPSDWLDTKASGLHETSNKRTVTETSSGLSSMAAPSDREHSAHGAPASSVAAQKAHRQKPKLAPTILEEEEGGAGPPAAALAGAEPKWISRAFLSQILSLKHI